ncbi:MAG: 2-C-methyl-D-erythritol 4-phosphate cytidylyltransferase [Candidatus Cloacimonetes bacterium]|nr:2-C-methyl-D-erythritol 4-phosphate cytidylyltransferase [Candidatus Cloacimonadota bacterium]
MKTVVIITAGGSGKRMNNSQKKQFMQIKGKSILAHTIEKFINNSDIDDIVISLPEAEIDSVKVELEENFPLANLIFAKGGKERQNSVFNALKKCPSDTDFVMIHDGVRPFISSEDISRLLNKAKKYKAVIPVFKVKNTIKQVKAGKVVRTIPRDNLVNVLTPQVFEYQLIFNCTKTALENEVLFTDDSSIMEYYDYPVYVLECGSENFKITDPFDYELAKMIIENNGEDKK